MSDRQTEKVFKFHWGLLLVWIAIGFILRFANLEAKPPSSIEISTLGFSLGHGFGEISLNRAIALETLLAPLQFHEATSPRDVIERLFSESNHPPFYFVLTHLWLKLFSTEGKTASLWAARSLSALIGVASIPAMYGLGWLAFRSRIIAQIAAALMAVSPYGIYLAQEARHYTLSILWIISSLCCLVEAMRCIEEKAEGRERHEALGTRHEEEGQEKAEGRWQRAEEENLAENLNVERVRDSRAPIYQETQTFKKIPYWLVFTWIIVNSLGIATHYLFVLVLAAEAFAVIGFILKEEGKRKAEGRGQRAEGIRRHSALGTRHEEGRMKDEGQEFDHFPVSPHTPHSSRLPIHDSLLPLFIVALGTLAGALVWLPVAGKVSNNELTEWVKTSLEFGDLWEPIPRLLAWWITMAFMLPVEGTPLVVTAISGVIMLLFLAWAIPAISRGVKVQMAFPTSRLAIWVLGGFLSIAIAIFLVIIYGYGKDLSKAARYHFVYFPAAIAILAATVAVYWEKEKGTRHEAQGTRKEKGKRKKAKIRNGNLSLSPTRTTLPPSPHPRVPVSPSLPLQYRGKNLVVIVLLMGFLGGLTVVSNYGYQKSKQSDRLATQIYETSNAPVLIAMTYESHAELRTLIGLGLEIERQEKNIESFEEPKFLLLQNSPEAFSKLTAILKQLPRPLDFWAIDLQIDKNALGSLNCQKELQKFPGYGYRYWLSHCR